MLFKCKMCGGDLVVAEGMTVCECEYCGTMQTLPKTDSEQQMNMINRANHFRQQCEFDKAMEIYERILKNSEDAEIYWNIVLCRYGIEYVDDPKTKKKIATCHRTQYKSILNDVDYLEALKRADIQQIALYKQEAEYIDSVNKGILEISNKEEPFDIFICYKETDDRGRRTQDSVLAQDLYFQLTQAGYKVFFSRITLESKLGTQYEPYIFAALNSSKVMVVIGTKPEYFNAVWVRNEWSRYLMMMQEDKNKTIIPAYRDMDPYDLPDELSMYQAQDMSKLGFMQDLIRGIEKITNVEPQKTIVKEVVHEERVATNSNLENLLKRGSLALEDGDWDEAEKYFDRVLDEDVEESRAYFGKFLADIKCVNEDSLVHTKHDFSDNANYKKAVRFGNENYKAKMAELLNEANYNFAMGLKKSAKTDNDYRNAKARFSRMTNYQDSKKQAEECEQSAQEYLYQQALKAKRESVTDVHFRAAKSLFLNIAEYKDSKKQAEECEQSALEYLYQQALGRMRHSINDRDYNNVAAEFEKLKDYKDSKQKVIECRNESKYHIAKKFKENNTKDDLQKAITRYDEIIDFKDSRQQIENCKNRIAEIEAEEKLAELEKERIHQERIQRQLKIKRQRKILAVLCAITVLLSSAATASGIYLYRKSCYESGIDLYEAGNYTQALEKFEKAKNYKKAITYVDYATTMMQQQENSYQEALSLLNDGYLSESKEILETIKGYKDANDILENQIPQKIKELEDESLEYLLYEAYDDHVEITGCNFKDTIAIAIPSEIDNLPVTTIAEGAFYNLSNLQRIVIPYTITNIENHAFVCCSELTKITIPNSVETIGEGAFRHCSNLEKITIPESVKDIGENALADCEKLEEVTFLSSVICHSLFENDNRLSKVELLGDIKEIPSQAFIGCSELTEVSIPDSVEEIGDDAFKNCNNLEKVTLSVNLKNIGAGAFWGCSSLGKITIPDSVKSIGESAFWGCTNLSEITIPDSVESIGEEAFEKCEALMKIVLPNSLETIENGVFYYCSSLVEITIPNSVTNIGAGAFGNCMNLIKITIPDSVASIGGGAFQDCKALTEITLPSSLESIGTNAFLYCESLTNVYYSGGEKQWKSIEIGGYNDSLTNATISYNVDET